MDIKYKEKHNSKYLNQRKKTRNFSNSKGKNKKSKEKKEILAI